MYTRMPDDFTEQYQNILHSIEEIVVKIYREHPDLADFQVDKVFSELTREYAAAARNRTPPRLRLSGLQEVLYPQVKKICDFYLGGAKAYDAETGEEMEIPIAYTHDEIIACLKRLRRSINLWTQDFGRQGYLNYVTQFFPHLGDTDEE